MVDNTAFHLISSKLACVSFFPTSLFLVGGIVTWRLWRKQNHIQNEARELSEEVKHLEQKMEKLKASMKEDQASTEPDSSSKQVNVKAQDSNSEQMGLFEYLINENIRIRQQA